MRYAQEDPDEISALFDEQPVAQMSVPAVSLRILATTDVHMQLVGYDYALARPAAHTGLCGIATLIAQARREAEAKGMMAILVDNGDFLQGTALGDHLAHMPVTTDHPIVRGLQYLRYDAMGLGNHDLDHGMEYLNRIARCVTTPLICSNLALSAPTALRSSVILTCPLTQIPKEQTLRVGILSVLPQETSFLNAQQLAGWGCVTPAAQCVTDAAQELRRNGADVVILLAHMGMEGPDTADTHQDDLRRLARIPGIDAIVGGHTHLRLPGQDHLGYADVDVQTGSLGNCPTAMAGVEASDLAVLDLTLLQADTGQWRVQSHQTQLRPNGPQVPPDPALAAIFAPEHAAVRSKLKQPCGHSSRAIHTYFSLAMPTAASALVAHAKRLVVAEAIANLPESSLPLLATAAAHTAGGRGGPQHYLHIRPGVIHRRHLAGFNPYPNNICALKVTGADLHIWLEHAAEVFHQLLPDSPDQPLLNDERATYRFDTIYGLTYTIDPSQPIGQRINNMCHAGRPVAPGQPFVLATSGFRAGGGGGGTVFNLDKILYRDMKNQLSSLTAILKQNDYADVLAETPWRFACARPIRTILHSSPDALGFLDEIEHLSPEPCGTDSRGFARIRLTL